MTGLSAARMLQLHLAESDAWAGKPLYEVVVEKCREMRIAGATVFRGLEGYGGAADIRRQHLAAHDLPVIITIVDTPENIERLAPVLEEMMVTGAVVVEDVRIRRIQKLNFD